MKFKQKEFEFMNNNSQLIRNGDFDTLYERYQQEFKVSPNHLTNLLLDCDVNPLDFVHVVIDRMFEGAVFENKFRNLKVNPSVIKIGDRAFLGSVGLKSIDLGNVKYIGDLAFSGCSELESIDLTNVQSVGNDAFKLCKSLKVIHKSDSLKLPGSDSWKSGANNKIGILD